MTKDTIKSLSRFMMSDKLGFDFFNRYTLDVAKELIGKELVYKNHRGFITETEAYMGFDDPASHAFRGRTPRNAVMFGPAGYAYIYFIYGMYHCLNVTTQEEGFPAAVLIRGVLLEDGTHLNGPGKLCRHFELTKAQNGIDMTVSPHLFITHNSLSFPILTTPRIGIKVGVDLPWRFVADI